MTSTAGTREIGAVPNPRSSQIGPLGWLLVVAVVLAPMTGARLGKVGPAEVIILLWCLLVLTFGSRQILLQRHVFFWIVFLTSCAGGTGIGLAVAPRETDPAGLATWAYFAFIAPVISIGLRRYTSSALERILRAIAIGSSLWYFTLWIYASFVSASFLGTPLWYGGLGARFSGGATNPHQVALLLAAVLGLHARRAIAARTPRAKAVSLGFLAVTLPPALATESSTLLVALMVTLAVMGVVLVLRTGLRAPEKFLVLLTPGLAGLLAITQIEKLSLRFIAADQNGLDRFAIWRGFGTVLETSPILGLGPGTHARDGSQEFHNTVLDVWAMGGLVALVALVIYLAVIARDLRYDPTLLLVLCPLLTYGVAGFSVRRLVFWVLLMLVAAAAEAARTELGSSEYTDRTSVTRGEKLDSKKLRVG